VFQDAVSFDGDVKMWDVRLVANTVFMFDGKKNYPVSRDIPVQNIQAVGIFQYRTFSQ
jgi:hypothetical protein